MTHRLLFLGASLFALGACATTAPVEPVAAPAVVEAPAPAAPSAEELAKAEHDKLFALFARSDEDSLKRNPLNALFRGDMRYADRLGDNITDAYFAGEKAAAEADLAGLAAIDRAKLSATDQIAYDVFKFTTADTLRSYQPDLLALTRVRPMNHFYGIHTFYPTFASGEGAAPFKTLEDYENNLKRHKEFVTYLDRAIARWREGEASGVVDTKLTVRNMIEQVDNQLKQKPSENSYLGPIRKFPDSISAADRARLTSEYQAAYNDEIRPALTRVRDFLKTEYLPKAREGVGLMYMKGGPELYRYLIKSTTTLDMTPEQIHDLGLSEVSRITAEMEKVRAEVGFKGDLQAFFNYLRTDKKFKPKSREALTQGYYDIGKKVDAELPRFFSVMPKAKLEIRPYEPFREKFEAGGSYQNGTPDGSRPGVFYFNAYDLPSRTTPGMTTLYLHEGSPGHHFQISLAQENEALPAFMRFGGNTAFVEGWALYAETLGYDMGFYKDPYQRMGTLDDEMLRAMRLVVDTGIHSKGWTRDQSIKYMLDHSSMGKTDATAEVERYIAIPSQATAYKIGALTIQRLRAKAQAELGDKFDIRTFHEQVLGTGALPLAVLEQKIDAWIAVTKG
ncbi:DUF885 domain-containing protein [Sphingomonas astaxanthinifaciens]|uniref:DUF885 domain-containing protein n=1 Tax=Sphingomonas astaxanthinifaciens DSM 22298 TaxID=1123267 RepID=A0ABQ5ZBH3_9SPHN|nr:DUF885 domain-containing protein [Sphingomonas astaxanthinifaciens]GLR48213.1 hypothetical protein GCM10007925_19260 [Sphingomonas astaxanthinifaciens DSM 22298]